MDNSSNNEKSELLNNLARKNKTGSKIFSIGLIIITLLIGIAILIQIVNQLTFFNAKTIILEPVCYATQTCDEILLAETAELLANRANAIGYNSATFKVKDNHLIYAKVPKDFDEENFFNTLKNNHLLEFVDFEDDYKMEGALVQTSTDENLSDNQSIFHTVLTNQNIQSAEVIEQNGQILIEFEFDEEGAQIFSEFTATHIGKYLGIVLDKEVLSCPYINAPIIGSSGVIQGNFTYDQAIELAGSLAAKPLPYDVDLYVTD